MEHFNLTSVVIDNMSVHLNSDYLVMVEDVIFPARIIALLDPTNNEAEGPRMEVVIRPWVTLHSAWENAGEGGPEPPVNKVVLHVFEDGLTISLDAVMRPVDVIHHVIYKTLPEAIAKNSFYFSHHHLRNEAYPWGVRPPKTVRVPSTSTKAVPNEATFTRIVGIILLKRIQGFLRRRNGVWLNNARLTIPLSKEQVTDVLEHSVPRTIRGAKIVFCL